MPTSYRRALGACVAALLVLVVLPAAASAQATRTWVSGVGDDANPCSRTAPCKTFAGAISKTAAKGEINALDPGGFGAVTITKAITIRAHGTNAGILVSGANGINISAGANDRVTLDGLRLNGMGTAVSGVKINSGKVIRLQNLDIQGFTTAGIEYVPTTADSRLFILNSHVFDNQGGAGVKVAPLTGTDSRTVIRRSEFEDNLNGVVSSGAAQKARINLFDSSISGNSGTGILAIGSLGRIRISRNDVTSNATGLAVQTGGGIESAGDNIVAGNDADGDPTLTFSPK